MNELSLFLYLADVSGNLESFAIVTLIASGIISALCFLVPALDRRPAEEVVTFRSIFWKSLVTFIVAGIMVIVAPSRDTLIMIAASEIGEEVLVSPEMQKVRDIINKNLDDIITGTSGS